MKIKIRIKTPKGNASGTVSGSKWFFIEKLLNLKGKKGIITTNKHSGDDTITWIVEGSVREMMAINKRVNMFDIVVSGIFKHKWLKKALKKMDFTDEQKKEVASMLQDMTKIEVVRGE